MDRLLAWVVPAVLLGTLALAWPKWGPVVATGLLVLFVYGVVANRLHCARRNAERPHDSICTFARSFPRRSVDTHVIRAVWNELLCGYPVRASDRLLEDIGLEDPGMDLDLDGIAASCGRSMAHAEENPWYDRVSTVGDLVRFVDALPRAAA